ncbi:hypothetical protein SAMN03159358_1527 [Paenibacillus sp. NFR01]|nr:hypothetical protein SAMN03159358_1527 [Paenibacillus sp. NFR01]
MREAGEGAKEREKVSAREYEAAHESYGQGRELVKQKRKCSSRTDWRNGRKSAKERVLKKRFRRGRNAAHESYGQGTGVVNPRGVLGVVPVFKPQLNGDRGNVKSGA